LTILDKKENNSNFNSYLIIIYWGILKMNLIDTHAHLESLKDLEGSLNRAKKAGLTTIIAMGVDYDSDLWVLNESVKYQNKPLNIYQAIGIHPHNLNTSKVESTLKLVEENIDKIIAIGEIGLDYWYKEVRKNPYKKNEQQEIFKVFLKLAKKNEKPVSIHSRGAWSDCVKLTIEAGIKKAVFHWFTGNLEILDNILNQGYYVSATPAINYSKQLREVVKYTPLENLLLETDSPVIFQGQTSEPAHVAKVLSPIAQLKGIREEKVAIQTEKNAKALFKF
jgi:TatD DNase family protein